VLGTGVEDSSQSEVSAALVVAGAGVLGTGVVDSSQSEEVSAAGEEEAGAEVDSTAEVVALSEGTSQQY
jgi:hypothetical protein